MNKVKPAKLFATSSDEEVEDDDECSSELDIGDAMIGNLAAEHQPASEINPIAELMQEYADIIHFVSLNN